MYNIKLYDYVPKPEPVSSDYIIAAHYYGAWKKGAALLHDGFPEIYEYPERTPLMGYYDEENPEYADWEYKWALEHGINCFIHCWYRFPENENQPVTRQSLRCAHALHDAMFHSKYGDKMKFGIMLETSEKWARTNAKDLVENLLPFWIENYFKRPNYLKFDNKPVLFVYDGSKRLRNQFGSAKEQAETFDRCREIARKHGFDGMIFAAEDRGDQMADLSAYKECGYDFSFAYCWPMPLRPTEEEVIERQMYNMQLRKEYDPNYFVPTASCFWDPWPRLEKMSYIYGSAETQSRWHLSPNNWRNLLKKIKKLADSLPENSYGRKMIMIDNWNEWDEGHYVLPSYEFGFKYLQAIREELTHRDNLPDYRLPQQLGTNPINKNWEEPDLSGYCTHKLDKQG